MVISWLVFPFYRVYYCKVSLYHTSLFILEHLHTFIFEPFLYCAILMFCYARHICFTRFCYPVQTILRTLVECNSSKPIIDNHMILYAILPDYRIFELTINRRISAFVG